MILEEKYDFSDFSVRKRRVDPIILEVKRSFVWGRSSFPGSRELQNLSRGINEEMESLPIELYHEIGLNVSLEDLGRLSRVSTGFNSIYSEETFIKRRLQQEYPWISRWRPQDLSWNQAFIGIVKKRFRFIPLVENSKAEEIAVLWVDSEITYERLVRMISKIVHQYDPNLNPLIVYLGKSGGLLTNSQQLKTKRFMKSSRVSVDFILNDLKYIVFGMMFEGKNHSGEQNHTSETNLR